MWREESGVSKARRITSAITLCAWTGNSRGTEAGADADADVDAEEAEEAEVAVGEPEKEEKE